MGMLLLQKRINRDECSFVTKQHMFGVFTIDEFLRYRGSPFPASRTLCHPVLDQTCQTKPCLGKPYSRANSGSFALKHSGQNACGIPDGQTIIMTGGGNSDGCHNFVTRWEISFNYTLLSGKISQNIARITKAVLPGKSSLNVRSVCPVSHL